MSKEMTVDELKQVITDSVNENVAPKIDSLEKKVADLSSKTNVNPAIDRAEKSAEFIKSVVEKKTITTDTGSFGYTVPTELANAIHEKRDKIAKIRKNAFVFELAGNFDLPKEGTACTAYWATTEADTDLTESAPTIEKQALTDNYLVVRVRVPRKLLNTSAFNIENYISKLGSRALVSAEETAFIGGDGTGEPTGIRTSSLTSVSMGSTALSYDDLVNLFYAVPEQYRQNGKWLMSTMAIKLVKKLKDTEGHYIFSPTDNTIFGKEVLECSDIPENLGTSTDTTEIYFGDLQEYWIKDGETMQMAATPIPARLQVDLFIYQSVDGVIVNTAAFRKMTGVK